MVCIEVAWNRKVTNKVEIGETQYIVKHCGEHGQRLDDTFVLKEEALKFFDSLK